MNYSDYPSTIEIRHVPILTIEVLLPPARGDAAQSVEALTLLWQADGLNVRPQRHRRGQLEHCRVLKQRAPAETWWKDGKG